MQRSARVIRRGMLVLAWALGLLVGAPSRRASAQPEVGPIDAANVIPPRLRTDAPARYPETALRDRVREAVKVELVLEIDPTGKVRSVLVDRPAGHGFDEAAAEAAKQLVFEPATRGGTPIAAKIRFSYAFVPPPGRLVGRVARQATDSPIEGARVRVTDGAGKVHETTTAADGSFRIEGVAHGSVEVTVERERQQPIATREEIAPGEETELVLRMAPIADAAPPPPPPGVEEPAEEVRVRGTRPPREVTKRSISRDEIAVSPGTNGDALRALQNLPGVGRPPPFGGQLIVRGAAPEDTQYFLDGTNVPIVYHFGGLSSVVPTEALDRVDFYPGNFGAQYGRGMGGIIDVALRNPRADGRFHAMAQVDSIDARFLVERSLGKGWSFLAGARRSYFDVWLKLLDAGFSTAPRYYDYQLMVRKEFSPGHDLRLTFLGSDDRLELFDGLNGGDLVLGGNLRAAIGFWRAQARYENRITSTTQVRAVAAIGQDFIDFGFGENYADIRALPISGRAELSQRVARFLTANAGIDILTTPYEVTVRFPPFEKPGVPGGGVGAPPLTTRNDGNVYTPGAYVELEAVPARGTRIVPGVRADYTNQTKEWNASPRISARQDLTSHGPRSTVKAGAGFYYQPPSPFQLDPVFGQLGLRANRSAHLSLGFEQQLGAHAEVSVEGFYKKLDRLVAQENGNRGDGRIYGAETLVRWNNDPSFFGWIAYTISRSERRDDPSEDLRIFQFDQTHILTILASKAWGDGFRLGGRFRVVTGNLYTPNAANSVLDADRGSYLPIGTLPLYTERLDTFHQLDVRFDKTITRNIKPLSRVIAYIDIQNIYVHRAAEGVAYSYNYAASQPLRGLPLLAITGVRVDL